MITTLSIVIGLLLVTAGSYVHCQKTPQTGLQNGQLGKCTSSPNCVCSQNEDRTHAIAPFIWPSEESPIPSLAKIIKAYPRSSIISQNEHYLHAEFRSNLFSFIDDVEFLWIPESHVIQIRSCARCGYSDFGVNRTRMEELRKTFDTYRP
jgi:uncharacterized protein (DUF1499 family)